MLDDKIILIGGKNNDHIRKVLGMFKNIVYIEVIKLNDLPEHAEKILSESTHIFILYKEDDEEFQKKWPEMYANKKPVCINISESMTEYYVKKSIKDSFKPYLQNKMTELMKEITPEEDRSSDPAYINVRCVNCNKKELLHISVASKRAPICEECRKTRKEVKRGSE